MLEISEDPKCKMSLKRSDYGSTDEIVDEFKDLNRRCDTSSLKDTKIEDF